MKRQPTNPFTRIREALLALFAALVLKLPGAGAGRGRRNRGARPAWPKRRRRPDPGRGCAPLLGAATLLLVVALFAGAFLVNRTIARFTGNALPTPTRTPNIAALGPAPVLGPPSIDVATIRRELERYNSPAVDEAQAFYDLGVARGIDPAYCLAFFIIESSAGTAGVARTTYSIGNIKARPGEPSYQGYRRYRSWREGIEDWYRLIDELYVGQWGLTTIDAIVPIYAPGYDSNDPAAYARTVKLLVARWRGL